MLALVLPAAVAAWWFLFRKPPSLTPAHEAIVAKAMASTNAPAIQKVAVAFGREGHTEVAARLAQRARLEGRGSDELKAAQRELTEAITAPVRSGDCRYTRATADKFRRRGLHCTGKLLEDYATGLERSRTIQPVLLNAAGNPEPGQGSTDEGLPPEVPGTGNDASIMPKSPNMFDDPMDVGKIPLGAPPVADWPEAEPGGEETPPWGPPPSGGSDGPGSYGQ